MIAALSAIALHELAHAAVSQSLGLRVKRFGISWRGVYMVRETGLPLQNLAVSLAGPLANLALALVSSSPEAITANLILCVFNLLPFPNSDGRKAWKAVTERPVSAQSGF